MSWGKREAVEDQRVKEAWRVFVLFRGSDQISLCNGPKEGWTLRYGCDLTSYVYNNGYSLPLSIEFLKVHSVSVDLGGNPSSRILIVSFLCNIIRKGIYLSAKVSFLIPRATESRFSLSSLPDTRSGHTRNLAAGTHTDPITPA